MSKSQETWNKKEKEKIKQKKKQEKAARKEERKAHATDGSLESMMAYVDEYGNITSTPPDPMRKSRINAAEIEVSVPKRKHEEAADPNRQGVVTFYNSSKGFGFIQDSTSKESIFTHVKGHMDQIQENDKVSFRVEQGPKGLNAVDVKLIKA